MKKILVLGTTFILALTLFGRGALAAPTASEVTGTWYLFSIEVEGTLFNTASLNMDTAMTLMEDNTATIVALNKNTQEATWAMEADRIVVTTGNASESYALSDGCLIKEGFGGMTMLYGREQPTAEPVVLPPIRVDAVLGDFNGKWVGYAFYQEGRMIPLIMGLVFEASLEIENGSVTCSIVSDAPFKEDYSGAFEGGELIVVSNNVHEDDMGTLTLAMREDGTLSSLLQKDYYMLFRKAQ